MKAEVEIFVEDKHGDENVSGLVAGGGTPATTGAMRRRTEELAIDHWALSNFYFSSAEAGEGLDRAGCEDDVAIDLRLVTSSPTGRDEEENEEEDDYDAAVINAEVASEAA